MHQTWDSLLLANRRPTDMPAVDFDDLLSSIFTVGSFYYYVIDFFDMGISHVSEGFASIHGKAAGPIRHINDVLALIHPDDIDFVAQAEKRALDFMYEHLLPVQFTRYKASYKFRIRVADVSYRLFNHQSLMLTTDENNNFIKSLNIHTDISHLASRNNYKVSIIGLGGEPSYLNLAIDPDTKSNTDHLFSKRELQVIDLIAKGYASEDIAEELCISLHTVKTHRRNMLAKAGCRNTSELVARGMSEGWI
jgi:DNA-binding CsgD family transcriptional regulator